MEAGANVWGGMSSWAQKAKKAVGEQARATMDSVQQGSADDLESAEGGGSPLAAWTKGAQGFLGAAGGAADRARQGLAQAAEKTGSVNWAGHAKAWSGDLASSFNKAADHASKAGAGFSEGAKMAAGSAKDKLGGAGAALGGMGALANPKRLIQFAGMFMVGMFLISMSLSFLPLLPIAPQKFALLFAMGSGTMLGSVAWLKGFRSFASIAMQRDKLPFSLAYAVGLLGTFWATLIARSYLMTSVFAFLQFVGLMYFMASFVPGGKTVLNFFGRYTTRGASALIRRK